MKRRRPGSACLVVSEIAIGMGARIFGTPAQDFVGSNLASSRRVERLEELLGAADVSLSAELLSGCDMGSRELSYPIGPATVQTAARWRCCCG